MGLLNNHRASYVSSSPDTKTSSSLGIDHTQNVYFFHRFIEHDGLRQCATLRGLLPDNYSIVLHHRTCRKAAFSSTANNSTNCLENIFATFSEEYDNFFRRSEDV